MVQMMKNISNKEAAPAIGLHQPVPSGAASSLEMTFEQLKYFIRRFEPMLWEDQKLEIAITAYGLQTGKWQGKFEPDDIWPFDPSKAKRPFSDYQIRVWESLLDKRKEFQGRVGEILKHYRL